MAAKHLSGRVGPGSILRRDPGSIRTGRRAEREIIFRLGVGTDADDARKVVQRFRGSAAAREALEAVRQYWKHTLGRRAGGDAGPSFNVMTNGWLVYQISRAVCGRAADIINRAALSVSAISCRM